MNGLNLSIIFSHPRKHSKSEPSVSIFIKLKLLNLPFNNVSIVILLPLSFDQTKAKKPTNIRYRAFMHVTSNQIKSV